MTAGINKLPSQLVKYIGEFLDIKDLQSLEKVSHAFQQKINELLDSNQFMKKVAKGLHIRVTDESAAWKDVKKFYSERNKYLLGLLDPDATRIKRSKNVLEQARLIEDWVKPRWMLQKPLQDQMEKIAYFANKIAYPRKEWERPFVPTEEDLRNLEAYKEQLKALISLGIPFPEDFLGYLKNVDEDLLKWACEAAGYTYPWKP